MVFVRAQHAQRSWKPQTHRLARYTPPHTRQMDMLEVPIAYICCAHHSLVPGRGQRPEIEIFDFFLHTIAVQSTHAQQNQFTIN